MQKKRFWSWTASVCLVLALTTLWFAFLLLPPQADSGIYTWRDENGALHVTDMPPIKGHPFVEPRYRKPARKTALALPGGKGKLFLWTVSSPSAKGYLLGTIHFGSEEMYPLDQRIEEAFEQSSVVAVEANPRTNTAVVVNLVLQLGTYPKGDNLLRHISRETVEMLREQGVDVQAVSHLRPWLLAMQLETNQYKKLGYSSEYGIESHFLEDLGNRDLVELESVKSQLHMLSQIPEGNEDAYLQKTIRSLASIKDFFPILIDLWRRGDTKKLEAIALRGKSGLAMDPRTYRLMIHDRNKVMAARVIELLQGTEPFFVMAGSLHMVGPDGVPTLLAAKGFKVHQVGAE